MMVLRMVLLVVLHAMLLADVAPFGQWTRPQWALWALFMVPPQIGPFTKLLAGFGLGLALDIAMGTYGHHMVAGTVLGGFLPTLHQLLSPREGYEVTQRPNFRDLGANWVIVTTFIGALVFHLTLAVVDTWLAHLMIGALAPAVTSAAWTTACCLLLHLLAAPSRTRTS